MHFHPTDNYRLKFELLFNNPFVHSSSCSGRRPCSRVGGYSTEPLRRPRTRTLVASSTRLPTSRKCSKSIGKPLKACPVSAFLHSNKKKSSRFAPRISPGPPATEATPPRQKYFLTRPQGPAGEHRRKSGYFCDEQDFASRRERCGQSKNPSVFQYPYSSQVRFGGNTVLGY